MSHLRLIVVFVLVATALSAPTWSQQLKQLTAAKATFSMKQLTSSLASSSISSDCQSNGGCSNCQTDISGDFWGSSVSSGSPITAGICSHICENNLHGSIYMPLVFNNESDVGKVVEIDGDSLKIQGVLQNDISWTSFPNPENDEAAHANCTGKIVSVEAGDRGTVTLDNHACPSLSCQSTTYGGVSQAGGKACDKTTAGQFQNPRRSGQIPNNCVFSRFHGAYRIANWKLVKIDASPSSNTKSVSVSDATAVVISSNTACSSFANGTLQDPGCAMVKYTSKSVDQSAVDSLQDYHVPETVSRPSQSDSPYNADGALPFGKWYVYTNKIPCEAACKPDSQSALIKSTDVGRNITVNAAGKLVNYVNADRTVTWVNGFEAGSDFVVHSVNQTLGGDVTIQYRVQHAGETRGNFTFRNPEGLNPCCYQYITNNYATTDESDKSNYCPEQNPNSSSGATSAGQCLVTGWNSTATFSVTMSTDQKTITVRRTDDSNKGWDNTLQFWVQGKDDRRGDTMPYCWLYDHNPSTAAVSSSSTDYTCWSKTTQAPTTRPPFTALPTPPTAPPTGQPSTAPPTGQPTESSTITCPGQPLFSTGSATQAQLDENCACFADKINIACCSQTPKCCETGEGRTGSSSPREGC